MELAFATRALRSLCEDTAVAQGELDGAVVEQLQARLADLRAADSVDDLVVGVRRPVDASATSVTLDLSQGYGIVCQVNHPTVPVDSDGNVAWARVRRLLITGISRDST
jgi:hypothetical protein